MMLSSSMSSTAASSAAYLSCAGLRGRAPQELHCRLLSKEMPNCASTIPDNPLPASCASLGIQGAPGQSDQHAQL